MPLLLLFALFLFNVGHLISAPLQIINTNGLHTVDFTTGKFISGRTADTRTNLKTLSVLDCTGTGDCKFVNKLLETSFRQVNGELVSNVFESFFAANNFMIYTHLSGVSLEVLKSTAVLYATFNSTFSNKFCGAKAVDYQCSLSSSEVQPCLTVAMVATDLELALQSYDQIFRRLLKFVHDKVSTDVARQGLTVTVLLDESGAETESSIADYTKQIEAFLNQLWIEHYDKVSQTIGYKSAVFKCKLPPIIHRRSSQPR